MTTKNIETDGTATPCFIDDDELLELPIFVTKTSLEELMGENSIEGHAGCLEPKAGILPPEYSPSGSLPEQVRQNLLNRCLETEVQVWLEWMWESAQPPSYEMALEAVYWLEQRAINMGDKSSALQFIHEVSLYLEHRNEGVAGESL